MRQSPFFTEVEKGLGMSQKLTYTKQYEKETTYFLMIGLIMLRNLIFTDNGFLA
jgi:hypothetical protein